MKLSSLLKNTDIIRANIDLGTEIKDIKYHSDKVEKGDTLAVIHANNKEKGKESVEILKKIYEVN